MQNVHHKFIMQTWSNSKIWWNLSWLSVGEIYFMEQLVVVLLFYYQSCSPQEDSPLLVGTWRWEEPTAELSSLWGRIEPLQVPGIRIHGQTMWGERQQNQEGEMWDLMVVKLLIANCICNWSATMFKGLMWSFDWLSLVILHMTLITFRLTGCLFNIVVSTFYYFVVIRQQKTSELLKGTLLRLLARSVIIRICIPTQ